MLEYLIGAVIVIIIVVYFIRRNKKSTSTTSSALKQQIRELADAINRMNPAMQQEHP